MSRHKLALFDVDGVLIIPPKLFSEQYCKKYGVDPERQRQFYATQEFKDATTGKTDLLDAIRTHQDLWQWHDDPKLLLDMWLEAENYPNKELFSVVSELHDRGVGTYIVTQQEKYRTAFLKDKVFKDLPFDGMFSSCEIGFEKHDAQFWEAVLAKIRNEHPGIESHEIVYFDDRSNLVELAKTFGIDAYAYESARQVEQILGLPKETS